MTPQDHAYDDFDDDTLARDEPWPALGWIIFAATVAIIALMFAPVP